MLDRRRQIPLAMKLVYTAFVAVLVPYYWRSYGASNFLWLCDIALLLTLAALWLESAFLASMQAVGIVLPQLLWLVDFVYQAATGSPLMGLAQYMFNPDIPLFVRGLSSFHGWLPLVLICLVWRLGYDPRSWLAQTLLAWLVLPISYAVTAPPPAAEGSMVAVNVNWVYGPGEKEIQTWMPAPYYLALLMLFFPACIYLPSHLLFRAVFASRADRQAPPAEEMLP